MNMRTSSEERVWSTQGSQRRSRSRLRSATEYRVLASPVSSSFSSTPGATVRRNIDRSQSFRRAGIARLGDGRGLVAFGLERMSQQGRLQELKGGLRVVGVLEQVEVFRGNHLVLDQRVEVD